MIVELFGPPAVGKTSFVHALDVAAQSRGLALAVVLSERPAERAGGSRFPAALARFATANSALSARHPPASREPAPHEVLLRAYPPRNLLWAMRLRNYLRRLEQIMQLGRRHNGVTILDQGFVQALGSLLVLARDADGAGLATALAAAPRTDLQVRLVASPAALRRRLERRFARMSWAEHWLELDVGDNLAFIDQLDRVQAMLEATGSPVITVDSSTPEAMDAGVARVLEAIAAWRCPASIAATLNGTTAMVAEG